MKLFGLDVVKTKIKDTLNKYIEKIEDSYFEIETGEKNE